MTLLDIFLPKVGMSTVDMDILAVLVHVGEDVRSGQPLLTVSTDKVDFDVESPHSGRVHEVLVEVDENYPVGYVALRLLQVEPE